MVVSGGCGPRLLSKDKVLLFFCCYCFGKGKRESVINISPTLWSSRCLLEDKGLSSHPWVVASKLGASGLSTRVPWIEGSAWMLSGERKSTFGSRWGSVSGFCQWEGRRGCCLCRLQPRRGQHSPRIGRGAGRGCWSKGAGEGRTTEHGLLHTTMTCSSLSGGCSSLGDHSLEWLR